MKYFFIATLFFSFWGCEKRLWLDIGIHKGQNQTAQSIYGTVEISAQTWQFLRYSWLWNRGTYKNGKYSEEIWVEGSYKATFMLEPRVELLDLPDSEKRVVAAKYHLLFFDREGVQIAKTRHYLTQFWSFPGRMRKKVNESFSIAATNVEAVNQIDSIAVEFFSETPFEWAGY